MVKWGVFVQDQGTTQNVILGNVPERNGDAVGEDSSLSVDGRNDDALCLVMIFEELPCNSLNAPLDSLRIQNHRFAGGVGGCGTHSSARSGFPSFWGRVVA